MIVGDLEPMSKRAAHLLHDTRQICDVHDQVVVLGDLPCDLHDGGLLEGVCANHAPWHLQSRGEVTVSSMHTIDSRGTCTGVGDCTSERY